MVLVVKKLSANAVNTRDTGSIPRGRRFPGERNGDPLQYSGLENPMDRGVWWAPVHELQRVRQDRACMHACMTTPITSFKISKDRVCVSMCT